MIRVGLRFHRGDVALLEMLAESVRRYEFGERDVQTFSNAAIAAATGEPLIVLCEQPEEAVAMADGYTRFGVRRPAVEELTGLRPNR